MYLLQYCHYLDLLIQHEKNLLQKHGTVKKENFWTFWTVHVEKLLKQKIPPISIRIRLLKRVHFFSSQFSAI